MTWHIQEAAFDTEALGRGEVLMALGNGYLGLRSAHEESYCGETRNLFIAGTYNRFDGHEVTELPNGADVLALELVLDGCRFTMTAGELSAYDRQLSLRDGELVRRVSWRSPAGKRYEIVFRRFVSLADRHLIGLQVTVTPLDGRAAVRVRTGLDGRTTNSGVQHFREGEKRVLEGRYLQMKQETTEQRIPFVWQAAVTVRGEGRQSFAMGRRQLETTLEHTVAFGESLTVEKLVRVHTGLDPIAVTEAEALSLLKGAETAGYEALLENSRRAWEAYWEAAGITVESTDPADQRALRFAQYHLRIMTPVGDSRYSVGAKGLTGEGYKGHVFWDTEIFILPVFLYLMPQVARDLLLYRFNTLAGARQKASDQGYRGAMFPWEAAATGQEETPEWAAVNILTGRAERVWSGVKEHHITADIAYAVGQYYRFTGDRPFMAEAGLELLVECARFWVSRLEPLPGSDKLGIRDVIGPDEYTEHIDNNAYTNHMAHQTLLSAAALMDEARSWPEYAALEERLSLSSLREELHRAAARLYLPEPGPDGVVPQDDTFLSKPTPDISRYRESNEKQPILRDYARHQVVDMQVLKQADVVMLMQLLEERFPPAVRRASWHYYEPRTTHDSSLSLGVHCITAAANDETELAYAFFRKACAIDLGENPHSSDDGIHAAALGGLCLTVLQGFCGLRPGAQEPVLKPALPQAWSRVSFPLWWRGQRRQVEIGRGPCES